VAFGHSSRFNDKIPSFVTFGIERIELVKCMSVTTLKGGVVEKDSSHVVDNIALFSHKLRVEIKYKRISCLSISSGCYHASNHPM
jgi:hypothetical protein